MALTIFVKNGSVIIDEQDIQEFNKYTWYVCNTGYVRADFNKRGYIYLHHLIIGKPIPPLLTDHINRNKLDNRRCNLRHITNRQNQLNSKVNPKGYYWRKERNTWQVRFTVDGRLKYFGNYYTESDAKNKAEEIKTSMRNFV